MSDDDYGYHSDAWDDGGYDEYYDDGYADDGNNSDGCYEADPHSVSGAVEEYSDGVQEERSDGYAEAESAEGVEGGGHTPNTSGQVDFQNFLIEPMFYRTSNHRVLDGYDEARYNQTFSRNYSDTGGPGGYDEASYNRNSSRNYGGADGHGTNDDLSKHTSRRYTPYDITYRGTNDQGNRYDNRIQPSGPAYHYSNQDGSYYYKNGDKSTYHNDGKGGATYTAPDGKVYNK